ncbi:MAG TPA: A24 family peptidase [Methylocystis sp.]|nr:A24 family peptidase [Methylocystis sp.]
MAPSLALFCALAVIALFDLRYFLIPDGPVLLLLVAGFATALALDPAILPERALSGFAGFATLWLAGEAFRRLRGVEGLGQGDARLFGLAGLWLGYQALPGCLLVAAGSGLVSALILLRSGGSAKAGAPMPFGPHIALGFWLAWAVGPLQFGG